MAFVPPVARAHLSQAKDEPAIPPGAQEMEGQDDPREHLALRAGTVHTGPWAGKCGIGLPGPGREARRGPRSLPLLPHHGHPDSGPGSQGSLWALIMRSGWGEVACPGQGLAQGHLPRRPCHLPGFPQQRAGGLQRPMVCGARREGGGRQDQGTSCVGRALRPGPAPP